MGFGEAPGGFSPATEPVEWRRPIVSSRIVSQVFPKVKGNFPGIYQEIIPTEDFFPQWGHIQKIIAYITGNPACSDIPAVVNNKFLVIPLVTVMQDIRAASACQAMAEYFYPDLFA